MTTRSIPLRRWIEGARKDSGSQDLSPAYLTSSLRIAVSLTEQISDAEELSAVGLSSGLLSLPPPFPVACIDWADCVAVTLKSSESFRDGNDLHFSLRSPQVDLDDAHLPEEDLEGLLDMIARDAAEEDWEAIRDETNFALVIPERNLCIDTEAELAFDYLDVECAQISSEGSNPDNIFNANNAHSNDHIVTATEKMQRIYSLGLVLYELFTGGESPPLDLLFVSCSSEKGLSSICAQLEGQEMECTGNRHGRAVVDFGNSLVMSNDNNLNRKDSVCAGVTLNHDNYLQADGSIDEPRMSSVSNKRPSIGSRQLTYARRSDSSYRQQHHNSRSWKMSVEFLNTKGIPHPLCELIHNMIDCMNGDLIGNDTYTEMSQVTNDLQLMIDKPSIFLRDLDVAKLSSTGLELHDTLFVRDDEFASLQRSYLRSLSGSSELAIITGVSGTGKSTLANKFGDVITADGGLFLRGKFDQMQQAKPFSAVASAFNNYFNELARVEESQLSIFVAELQKALGPDLYYLVQVIPNISRILVESATDTPLDHDCVNAQERLQYLFCRLVEVISCCFGCHISLFIDDVQWADSASISIIGELLKTSRSLKAGKRFFFLGSCRDDEMESYHSFWNMIDVLSVLGFKTTTVKLDCMNKDTLNEVMSNLLHLSPRLLRSLSDIVYHKTKGNPLFFTRMLLALNREGLLRISLTRHRWEWDEEKIQSRELPEDVAVLFINSIKRLPNEVNMALGTLSCFGASVDCDVINALESGLSLQLIDPLNIAIAEGLVRKLDGKYHFCHDRIQEAVYSMIEEQNCCLYHNKYGISLMDHSLRTGNVCLLFTAITQVNLGGPGAVQDPKQYSLIASYNLIAGKKAMEMSDFSSAFSFFDHGMTFLRKVHWREHYDLSLELFNLAAKCALAIKNLKSLTMICDEVLRNARTFEDTLYTAFIAMSALTHSMISESMAHGISILSQLGVDIPRSFSKQDALSLIVQTQSMLSDISDETLLNYRLMTDFRKLTAMKFLAKLEHSIQQVEPALQPLVTTQMVKLTIDHGLSPMSAIGIAYFGGMVAELGDIRGGYRFIRLAKGLVDKIRNSEIAGEVLWLSTEILSFIEPLQIVNEYRIQGEAMAMAAGDIHWACMNKASFCVGLFWCGVKLSVVKEEFTCNGRFIEERNHLTALYYLRTVERTVMALIGEGNKVMSDDELTRNVIENKNPYQLAIIYFQKMLLSLLINDYNEMKKSTENFIEFQVPSWVLLSIHAGHFFIVSLSSFRIYRETHDPLWAKRGKQYKERVIAWKEQGSLWNFESKSFLLEAEDYYSSGDFKSAEVSYDKAISSASQHKFVNEEALICDLAANFYLEQGNKSMALKYFKNALEHFQKWGAFAKVRTLQAFMEENFLSEDCSSGEINAFPISNAQRFNSDARKRIAIE